MSKLKENLKNIAKVAAIMDDDDPDKVEMLNREGSYADLLEWAVRKHTEKKAHVDAMKAIVQSYQKRQKSLQRQADHMKDIIKMIMETAGEKSYKGINGTVSLRAVPPKLVIDDEQKLIDAGFNKTIIQLDKDLLKKALETGDKPEGCHMSNGGETVAIRV